MVPDSMADASGGPQSVAVLGAGVDSWGL